MDIDIATVSQKGQVVIPSPVRQDLKIEQGDKFLVFGSGDTIILKRLGQNITGKKFREITKSIKSKIAERGITKADVEDEIRKQRSKQV